MKDLSLHILDIVQNSIRAEATIININIIESVKDNIYSIEIIDNGRGIPNDIIEKVTDPYFTTRTTRKVGLGISLLKANAEQTGGNLTISSIIGKGTVLKALFSFNHFDRQPAGDLPGVISTLAFANPNIDFIYSHQTDKGKYIFSTIEIKEVLDGVKISELSVKRFLMELIEENLNEIGAE